MPIHDLPNYRYRGARALVLLHERALRELLPAWRRANAAHVQLPSTKDPNYVSLESLLHHALRAARGYMTWLCEKLGLPDSGIDPAPEPSHVKQDAERYIEHLLERWRLPLADVEETRLEAVHKTRWGEDMSCEGMLEHAVMHPIRHRFQLEELLEAQGG
ncbi:MAG: hypothetical protein ABSF77_06920 [Spirochaetia bacterium]|jgi:uncharacterized damage-inducible protein DinB